MVWYGMVHVGLIRILVRVTKKGLQFYLWHIKLFRLGRQDQSPVSKHWTLSLDVYQVQQQDLSTGLTNQIVSTHFYPGFVSWLVKLAPVAQISWHQHPSHHHHQHWSTFINQNTGYSYSHTLHQIQWMLSNNTNDKISNDGMKKELFEFLILIWCHVNKRNGSKIKIMT